jgi:hypothetical protein
MWILEFIWNHVPWYVPLALVIIAAGFCWQWIAPIWMLLPRPVKWAIAFIGAIFVAIQYGRNRGVAGEQARRKSLNERALKQRDVIDAKVKEMPPNAVSDALRRNGWMRD